MEARCDETSTDVPAGAVKEEIVESAKQNEVQPGYNNNNNDEEDADVVVCTESQEAEIRDALSKCVFCEKMFVTSDEPKLLECLHASCMSCVKNKLAENTAVDADIQLSNNLTCQICNVTSQLECLIDNQFVTNLTAEECSTAEEGPKNTEEEKKCTSCHDNATATSWCVECEEFICQNCVLAHQRLKITKDHSIKPKEEVASDGENKKTEKELPNYLFCSLHPQEQLSLFCQTCDRLTCRDCQLSEHRDHKYKFIHEIAAETRTSVLVLLKEVSYKRVLLKSAMKVIEDRQVLITEKKKSLVSDITQMVVQLTNAINARGKQLILRLNEVCDQKQNTLNEKKIALDQLSRLTDHCIQFVGYALEKGSDMELLYSKKSVTNHLQRIKSRRADIPNPEIPVRIHLSLEKVPDLIKVVSSIGSIVVDGRTYPSASPSSGSNTPSGPSSETTVEPKQPSAGTPNLDENTVATPMVVQSVTPVQAPPAMNCFQPMSQLHVHPPIEPPIQRPMLELKLPHHPVQQDQQRPNPNNPNMVQGYYFSQHMARSSPQQMPPRVPYLTSYNNRMQQPPMINSMTQRSNHQQVTSSTHPQQQQQQQAQQQHLEQMNQNASLRGLLAHNPPAYRNIIPPQNHVGYRMPPSYRYATSGVGQRPMQQHAYQGTNASMISNMRMQQCPPNSPSPQHMNYHMAQQTPATATAGARWHIPQNVNPNVSYYNVRQGVPQQHSPQPLSVPINDSYKITLKNHHPPSNVQQKSGPSVTPKPDATTLTSAQNISNNNNGSNSISNVSIAGMSGGYTVSSSVSKTPSPSPQGKSDETEKCLDKFCQKSLNDLMQTIAKLDSNGIVVIPEAQRTQLDSTQVDSSTDEAIHALTDNSTGENDTECDNTKSNQLAMTRDDPNEDWCAVCMDGGAVLCCDRCPKVFHLNCHIPPLKSFPDESETWECMLCTNALDCPDEAPGEKKHHGMTQKELRIAQRIVLELYCQYEQSFPFRELVSPENVDYHRIIKKPIALDVIREKLKSDTPDHYTDLRQVMADIRLMFKNAFSYNPVESQVYQEARSLEEFFEKLLLKWTPTYAYDDPFLAGEDEEDVFPPNRKYRRIIND